MFVYLGSLSFNGMHLAYSNTLLLVHFRCQQYAQISFLETHFYLHLFTSLTPGRKFTSGIHA